MIPSLPRSVGFFDIFCEVMLAQFGDHGLPPSEASFFLHAQVAAHYLNGGWYPPGIQTIPNQGLH